MDSWKAWHTHRTPLRLGVSACLLGQRVRYDGGHARDRFVADTLGKCFVLVPLCPEIEIGMGAPRPPIRLEAGCAAGGTPRVEAGGAATAIRLVLPSTGEDLTRRMTTFSSRRIAALRRAGIDGFILKEHSPSCGMERVKVHRQGAPARREGTGIFARALREAWPELPVEEEGRLRDPGIRVNFLERVFGRNRWRGLLRGGRTKGRLVRFHTEHKLLLRAHNQAACRRLGKLIAAAASIDTKGLFAAYEAGFQEALRGKATPRKHARVLRQVLHDLRRVIDPGAQRRILTAIEDMRGGRLPLTVPLSLLRREIRRHGIPGLQRQLYLDPHPKEFLLRRRV